MIHAVQGGNVRSSWFGQRRLTPRACVADRKKHVRTFLAEALEDFGFITGECAQASELADALDDQRPDEGEGPGTSGKNMQRSGAEAHFRSPTADFGLGRSWNRDP